uniref:Eukaryotic translation initiation factor 4 gamma 3 n=2 Tax=Schistocephalus solidus TaxID=70667 RepID=A0A0X3PXK1_SCHSO
MVHPLTQMFDIQRKMPRLSILTLRLFFVSSLGDFHTLKADGFQHYAYAQSVSQACLPAPGNYSLPFYCMQSVPVQPTDPCTINPAQAAQPDPVPVNATRPKSKGLTIKDPNTLQTVDVVDLSARVNPRKVDVQQGHKPLVVKDPPVLVATDRHEPTHEENLVQDSVESSPASEAELKVQPADSLIQEDPKESDTELPADESESSDAVREEEEGSTAQDSDIEPNDSSANSVDLDVGEKIRRYDRSELIALRRVSETTAPNFLTQSAVSINHADRSSTCYRKEKQRRCITLKTNVKLDDVENAYKPAHLREPESSAENRTAKLSKDLNIILNRLLDDNISEIVQEIKKLSISGREEVSALVDVLTTKATRQTKYSEVFARLCFELSQVRALESFKMLLVSSVNKMFGTPLETYLSELNAKIDSKIAETTDEKVKKMLEEDRETAISKKRDAYLGIIQFFSHLYVHKLIADKSALESLRSFAKPTNQDEVLALLTCLNTCGPILEAKLPVVLKDCISGLEAAKKQVKMEQHVAYKIVALIELKNRQWKKQEPTFAPQTVTRSSDNRRDIRQRQVSTIPRRSSDMQHPVNVNALTVGGPKSARTDGFLGPRNDWTKGSSTASSTLNRQGKNRFHGIDMIHSDVSESESGRESRAPSSSTKMRVLPSENQTVRVDKKMSASEAISEAFDAFRVSDTPSYDLTLRESEKASFVAKILLNNVEKKDADRKMATDILAHVYKKNQLTTDQISTGFSELLAFCDEDFVLDCPKGDTYISEFLTAFVNESSKDLNLLVTILSDLPDERRRPILENCLTLASKRLGEEAISSLFSNSSIPWQNFNPTLSEGVVKCSTTTETRNQESEEDLVLKKLPEVLKNRDYESLRTIFAELASSSNTETLWTVVKNTMMNLQNAGRSDIDKFVQILKVVADGSEDVETKLLFTLQNVFSANETFRQFLQSLLQFKIISHDGLTNCCSKWPAEYKEMTKKVLKKSR